jgi:dihydroorotate dehydrogenase
MHIIIRILYKSLFRPIAFLFDPEFIHDQITLFGVVLGKSSVSRNMISGFLSRNDKILSQEILGIRFENPVGLAAGFDKNGLLTDILPSVGFGFAEIGSVTGEACEGNERSRLWRLKKSKALLVYYGLKNDGCEAINKRLAGKNFEIPIGISIAKTNSPTTVADRPAVEDYKKAFMSLCEAGDYMTINISCPNAYGGEPFTDPKKLEMLLTELDGVPCTKPVFLKLSPDLDEPALDGILSVAAKHRVHGFVCGNLTKNRTNEKILDKDFPDVGGISGVPLSDLADRMISMVYKKTKGKFVIIGCGGIFSAQDAYKKIRLGASLVQVITGMIYEGPQLIGEINLGLTQLLKKDGYQSISDAIGVDS